MENIKAPVGKSLSEFLIKRDTILESDDNHIFADKICLVFENECLSFSPITESDEIKLEVVNFTGNNDLDQFENIFPQFNGKKFNEFWHCENSRGYFDMFIVSFDQLHPSIIILSEGSVLKIFKANQS